MSVRESINLVSTYATDILRNNEGEIGRQPGGPMMYIERALGEAGVPFTGFPADPIEVEILITDTGEFGRVPNKPASRSIGELALSDWVIFSAISNEWTIPSDEPLSAKLFVDLQGIVRDGNDFGRKQQWDIGLATAGRIFCIKGTKEEVDYLPDAVADDQKSRLLLVTDGANGIELFYRGERAQLQGNTVNDLPDTIGAGDTFMGWFVAGMYQGMEPETAARQAMYRTEQFLQAKKEN